MECPNCKEELKVSAIAYMHMDTYGNTSRVRALCCGVLVTMSPETIFHVYAYDGNETEDDWGG